LRRITMIRTVVDGRSHPVFVIAMGDPPHVQLVVGDSKPGDKGHASLTPGQARILAYALLSTAEDVEQQLAEAAKSN
jgi:hypothetical protein